jgi:hypothetical protein
MNSSECENFKTFYMHSKNSFEMKECQILRNLIQHFLQTYTESTSLNYSSGIIPIGYMWKNL